MYRKIMVPLDGSELAECVFPHLETICRGCQIPEVHFVRVVDQMLIPVSVPGRGKYGFGEKDLETILKQRNQAAEDYLKRIVTQFKFDWAETDIKVLEGKTVETLVDYAEKGQIDLIMIASHGRSGVSRWVLGSVAERLLRASCVPILMVRAPGCPTGI